MHANASAPEINPHAVGAVRRTSITSSPACRRRATGVSRMFYFSHYNVHPCVCVYLLARMRVRFIVDVVVRSYARPFEAQLKSHTHTHTHRLADQRHERRRTVCIFAYAPARTHLQACVILRIKNLARRALGHQKGRPSVSQSRTHTHPFISPPAIAHALRLCVYVGHACARL